MPKLPEPAALERPTPQPAYGLAQYRGSPGFEAATAPGEAVARAGAVVAGIGEAIDKIDKELTRARRQSQLQEAVGKATQDLGDLEFSFQRDTDFKTAPKRFLDQSDLIRKKYDGLIDDEVVKQAFTNKFNTLQQAKRLNVLTSSAKKEGDHNVAVLDDNLNTFAGAAAQAVNEAERTVIVNEASLAIANLQHAGWITSVDAGKREREFLGKVDQATVIRDMAIDPINAAVRISTDPSYVPNIDSVTRERWIDTGLRRAETERARMDRAAEQARKTRGDELMKEGFDLSVSGNLTMDFVQKAKAFVSPTEYHSLIKMMDGTERRDDPVAFAELQRLVDDNPDEAQKKAFQFHGNGLIKNETLASVVGKARTISRQEGPKTEFERSRQYIGNALDPGPFSSDPAPKARYAIALREFEDFASSGKRTDEEVRKKADDVVKRHSLIDMTELARRTGLAAQPTPDEQLKSIGAKAESLMDDLKEKKITQQVFNRKMSELDKARKSAEKAKALNGK